MVKKKIIKRGLWILMITFVLMNVLAAIHAHSFTHYSESNERKSAMEGGFWSGFKLALTGISNPRPVNSPPDVPYEVVFIESNVTLECWYLPSDSATGTVIIFHGYGGCKSSMQDKASEFHSFGYNVLLVDFMGSGGSEGNETTVGYDEAVEVQSCYDYIDSLGEDKIVLYGTSMGAVAIMKAVQDFDMDIYALILECPFGTLYQTVCSRFDMMNMPSFPMAGLLTFWGGIENGFWAFDHAPEDYAKSITCPVLLLYGEKDPKVSRGEIDSIFANLAGEKHLVTFPEAGHENYLTRYRSDWQNEVKLFLEK